MWFVMIIVYNIDFFIIFCDFVVDIIWYFYLKCLLCFLMLFFLLLKLKEVVVVIGSYLKWDLFLDMRSINRYLV